jgi:hypothetical protein
MMVQMVEMALEYGIILRRFGWYSLGVEVEGERCLV